MMMRKAMRSLVCAATLPHFATVPQPPADWGYAQLRLKFGHFYHLNKIWADVRKVFSIRPHEKSPDMFDGYAITDCKH